MRMRGIAADPLFAASQQAPILQATRSMRKTAPRFPYGAA
jgi:hypothetical protein